MPVAQKRGNPISVFIPVSILSDVPSLIEKTIKVGQIARAASIFRVERIVVYRASKGDSREDGFLIRDLLSYAETPQYLKKKLFPISESLRYAGMMPPLRTPHHPLESTMIDYREGFVLKSGKMGSTVDIGLRAPVTSGERLTPNTRVTMMLDQRSGSWSPVSRADVPHYWGYTVSLENKSLRQAIEAYDPVLDSVVATSRVGKLATAVAPRIRELMSPGQRMAVLFGSPSEGVHEIIARDG
ncbi:MAG TPA: RNA methyltransferase, partial [Candidatus Methanomethylicus sp.]|nr:RNA methyltransferase [Candidatus Methanomethylicus sp.]